MRREQRGRRQRGASSGIKVLWAVLALLIVAGAGLTLWKLTDKPAEETQTAITVVPTAAPETTTGQTTTAQEQTEKTTAAEKPEETQQTSEAEEESRFPEQGISQKPLNQLLSVVGWALADERPDGFHSKYMETRDMAALTAGAMTLAAQGSLGLEVELTTTDDPNQAMLSGDEINRMLAYLVKDAALSGDARMGSLVPMGSGWAVTLPDDDVNLPRTEILETEEIEGGQMVTAALVQKTARGEMVLQTALVEVLEINGGFGYQVLSWITQDEIRFAREDGNGDILLSMGSGQRVRALELTWGEDAGEAVIRLGNQELVITPAGVGNSQVILLDAPTETETITITMDYPAALTDIRVY